MQTHRFRYTQEWKSEKILEAKNTLAYRWSQIPDVSVNVDENGRVYATVKGVTFEIHFDKLGFGSNKTIDINVHGDWSRKFKTIGRITPITDLYKPSLEKDFKEHAFAKADNILTERITAPALEKSQKKSEKTFEQWEKQNEKYLSNKAIYEVSPETSWNGKSQKYIGTDRIVINLQAWESDEPPTLTQLFGIIVQSGITVKSVKSNHIDIVGSKEEIEKFLEILNKPLEWKF